MSATALRCLKLAYLDRSAAADAKRQVMRQYGIACNAVWCEACEKFHLRSETWPPVRKWRDILVLIARGFRRREIAKTLGMTDESVSWAIYQMSSDWHALSQAHLITIVTSFGILEPDEFLLLDDDLARFRPRDSRRPEFTDAV
jgi:hypothetical protein